MIGTASHNINLFAINSFDVFYLFIEVVTFHFHTHPNSLYTIQSFLPLFMNFLDPFQYSELFFTWIFSCLLCYLIHKTFLARQTHRRGWKFIFWIMMSFECLKNDKRESIKSRWSWYRRIGTTKFKFIQLKFKRQRKSQNL